MSPTSTAHISVLRLALALAAPAAVFAAIPGCSDPVPAIPRVIIESTIGPGGNPAATCGISSSDWITIGNFGGPGTPPRPVDDKAAEGSGAVSASCSVIPEGDGFRVSAQASISGLNAGSIIVAGLFRPSPDPLKAPLQENITVVFSRRDFGRWEQKDCKATYSVSPTAGVAAGRIWAKTTCPTAKNLDNGARLCEATVQFRFENCEQAVTGQVQ